MRHDGSPRRVYDEIVRFSEEIGSFAEDLYQTKVRAEAAIIFSYDQLWAIESFNQYKDVDYYKIFKAYYKAFTALGITVDIVEPGADLSGYKMVAAPCMLMMTDEIASHLKEYTKQGGHLLLSVRSGIKDWNNNMAELAWPGLLSELSGVEVEEFEAYPSYGKNSVQYGGREYEVRVWADIMHTTTAKALAVTRRIFTGTKPRLQKMPLGTVRPFILVF